MVPVLVHVVRVRSSSVEPRVFAEVSTIRIEFVHWVETCSVVEYHIKDDCDTAFVTFINESLEIIRSTICTVKRKEVVRRVTPAIIAVELGNRHELYSVHTKILDIVKTIYEPLDIARRCVVIYPKFVDNEVVFVRAFEVEGSIRPFERRFVGLKNCDVAITLCGIVALVARNPFVIWMLEFGGIEIRNAHHFAISTNHYVLHSVLLTRVETCEFNPEVCTIISLLELVIVRDGPFVEITYDKYIFRRFSFASCICTKGNFSRVNFVVVDTIDDTFRAVCFGRCVRHASERSSLSCLRTRSSSKLNVIVTLFAECIFMC